MVCLLQCCFKPTESVRTTDYLGRGAQDSHFDFHTAPELWWYVFFSVALSPQSSYDFHTAPELRGEDILKSETLRMEPTTLGVPGVIRSRTSHPGPLSTRANKIKTRATLTHKHFDPSLAIPSSRTSFSSQTHKQLI